MTDFFVSPSFRPDKLASGKLDDKIDVFEDRFKIAIIEQAAALFSPSNPLYRHAGTSVLLILLPYFETIAQYRSGESSEKQSRKFFIREFLLGLNFAPENGAPAPTSDQKEAAATAVYEEIRCGFIHAWSQRPKVVLSNRYPSAIRVGFDSTGVVQIEIHPELFLAKVKDDLFPAFMKELRDPASIQLRANFEKFFDSTTV